MQEPIQETTLAGRYQIIKPLGRGGFGQTFLSKDLHLPDRPLCVIKKLQPKVSDPLTLATAKRLFDREAQTLGRLGDHNQIPRLFAHFEQDEEFYLVQEFIEGQLLDREITEGTKLSEASTVALLEDILQVLVFVHEQNVIHRDIKPANLIRRSSDRKIVLIDFGAVKEVSNQVTNSQVQVSMTVAVGSRGYMPNEQLAGNPRYSSDIYAVGILGIQALTGIHPRNLDTDARTSEVMWLDYAMHVSPGLAAVLDCMVAYDFRDRYPTAAEALAALQELSKANVRSVLPSQHRIETPQPLPNESGQSLPIPSERRAEPVVSSSQPRKLLNFAATVIPPTQTQIQSLKPGWMLAVFAVVGLGLTGLMAKTLLVSRSGSSSYDGNPVTAVNPDKNLVSPSPNSSPAQDSTPTTEKTASVPSSTPTSASHSATSVAEILSQADRLRKAGQYQQAIAVYDKAIATQPKVAEAQWGRCYTLNQLQRAAEAIVACDAALAIKPNYPEALWSKGYAQDLQQRPQEALKNFEQAIALKPSFAAAWSNQGAALQKLHRYNEAIAAFDKATALEPNYGEAWANRGVALWSLGRRDEAVTSIEKAIKVQPENQNARKLLQQAQKK